MTQQSRSAALFKKVGKGDIKAVQKLLSEGADVNYINDRGVFPLYTACDNGDVDMAALLLKNKAQIDLKFNGQSSLMTASRGNHIAVVELLLKNNANVDLQMNDGTSALFIASDKGLNEVVKLLLENGAKVNLQRNDGTSSLYIASYVGYIEVVRLLLENGAKVDLLSNSGISSLYVASQNGHVEVVKLLLEKRAKVNLQTSRGASALYIASKNGHAKVSKLLLEYGAKIDLQTNGGYSPLMIACERGQTDVTQVLLDHDADTYLRNNKGQTALEIAREKNCINIISLFAGWKEKAAYPGILCSEGVKKESITSHEKTVNLEEVGISLTFPENSLPSNEPPVEVTIQPCFSGSFIIPDGIESTSPAYVIKPNRKVKFEKDIVLKIRHNANLQTEEDCENMVFLSSSSTPEYRESSPVYVFKEITDTKGLFRPGQERPLGEIQLNHIFSIITTGIKRLKGIIGSKKGAKGNVNFLASKSKNYLILLALKKLYSARLFKTEKSAVFCMCLYQPLYMQVRMY